MVVDQRVEAVAATTVPDVPDEGTMVKQLAVLIEEAIAKPIIEAVAAHIREKLGQNANIPEVTEGRSQQTQQPILGRRLAPHRWDTDDPVFVNPFEQRFGAPHPFALLLGQFHTGI